MPPDIFVEWLHRQGYRVFQSESSLWVEAGPHIFQAFPYHRTISPTETELRSILLRHRGIGLRYSTPWTAGNGAASYHVVYEKPEYSLSSLPKKARYDVKRGLKNARVEPISFERLANEGWQVRLETLVRQGRTDAESKEWWRRLCRCAHGLPGFEAWAAIIDRRLVATLIAFTCDDCCSILYQQSRTKYLSSCVNNALTFVFTGEVLKRKPGSRLFYGLHSLDAPHTVDTFKFRMGYTAKPVRQRVVFHPLVEPFFKSGTHKLLRRAANRWPERSFLSKTEGMVRFYLQGQTSIENQPLPPPLDRSEILGDATHRRDPQ